MKLPNKPSSLIKLALADLKKVERSKKYIVDMGAWHKANGVCSVDLAGSVMAQTLNVPINMTVMPEAFDDDTENKLQALNDFRIGFIEGGLRRMNTPSSIKAIPIVPNCIAIPPYKKGKAAFHKAINDLVKLLESVGA